MKSFREYVYPEPRSCVTSWLTWSQVCRDCGDYVICSRCYDAGARCLSEDHIFLSRRSFMGTIAGKCQRMRNATTDIDCDKCGEEVFGLYFREYLLSIIGCTSSNLLARLLSL